MRLRGGEARNRHAHAAIAQQERTGLARSLEALRHPLEARAAPTSPALCYRAHRGPRGRRHHTAPGVCPFPTRPPVRSEEHTSELQSRENLVCRLLLEKK